MARVRALDVSYLILFESRDCRGLFRGWDLQCRLPLWCLKWGAR